MPRFAYQVRDGHGELSSGTLTAGSANDAGRQLRAEGKFIVSIAETAGEETAAPQGRTTRGAARRITRRDVIYIANQLAVMVDTGVTIGEAIESVAEQTTNLRLRAVLNDISRRIQGGASFSDALSYHPDVFPRMMVALLRASEATGTMGPMLQRICQYLGQEQRIARRVRGAMIYPLVMSIVAVSVTIFLLTFVLPRFAGVYASRGADLPAPTKLLMWLSGTLTGYWFIWVLLLAAAVALAMWFRRQPFGQRWIDHWKLHLPVIGTLFNHLYITRAMRTMGTMINAGVPVLETIAITREVTNNIYFDQLWEHVDTELQQGSQLSLPLFESELVPKSISRMVHSGEKAGRLGEVMQKVADFTEQDFDDAVTRATQFIEPAMIVFMGVLIGFVAISLLLPIFSVGHAITGGH
jgi:type IV pilus assembly protein PilC